MQNYDILKTALYNSIIRSLLKRHILSLDEAVGCFNDVEKLNKTNNDLIKDFTMVKQKGLTNHLTGKPILEV